MSQAKTNQSVLNLLFFFFFLWRTKRSTEPKLICVPLQREVSYGREEKQKSARDLKINLNPIEAQMFANHLE